MESRAFTRVAVSTNAIIDHNGTLIKGVTENLSLQGMYLRTSIPVPLHQPIKLTVVQPQSGPIQAKAQVVRHDVAGGMGVQISSIDVNSFVNLRSCITRQCGDFNGVMSETYKMINCIR